VQKITYLIIYYSNTHENAVKMKVLLIDDNVNITKMMSKYLQYKNHECIVTNDGRKGLELILEEKFDAVLLDLSMPEFSGFDVISYLEKNGKIKDQKIILFTASNIPQETINELLQKGAHSCLGKPVKMDVLLSTIEV